MQTLCNLTRMDISQTFIHLNVIHLLVAPTLAVACSLNRSLLATNVYTLTFLYHIICIGKINELVLVVLLVCRHGANRKVKATGKYKNKMCILH